MTKNSDWFKLEAFADNKINMNEKLSLEFGRIENIVGKKKMLVTSIFSFSHNHFQVVNSWDFVVDKVGAGIKFNRLLHRYSF